MWRFSRVFIRYEYKRQYKRYKAVIITIILYNQYIQSLYIHCLKTYKSILYTSEIHKIFTRVNDNSYHQ
nr:MAG TPA: hypothetical protein [Caudoviricetes sp.]